MAETSGINSTKTQDWKVFRRMVKLLKPYRLTFTLATALALLLAVVSPVKPLIIKIAIDDNILSNTGIGLGKIVLIFLAVLITESIMRYTFIYLTRWVGQSVIKDLRTQIYNHITSLKLRFFDTTPIGTLTTRTINDTEAVNRTFSDGLITIAADILTMAVILGLMFYTNWRLTLWTLVPFPLILFATYVFKEKVKKAFQRVRSTLQDLNSFLQEHVTGMKIVQLFAIEKREHQKFDKINKTHLKANTDTVLYYAVYFPVIEILSALALALIIWFAGGRLIQNLSTVGEISAFVAWVNMLFRPLRMLADKFNTLQMGIVASDRVFKLLDEDVRIEETGSVKPEKLFGGIEFDKVWFAYKDDDYVLRDVSFKLDPGQSLALVGSTGSGKTTTIGLINRFYEIRKGNILIDDKLLQEYNIQALRNRIATVQQDVFLFAGSVYDNIAMNDPTVTLDEVKAAAETVGVNEFIEGLPGQYDYQVMERGGSLSAGQRQLIAFIRAMTFNPDILILDEATAAIDTETEMLLQHATTKLMEGRTSIVIAHRLSTVKNADKIVVLDQGQIIEQGSHNELIAHNGAYKKLHDMQFKKQETAVL